MIGKNIKGSIAALALLLAACSSPESSGEAHMPFDTMVQVMADIHVIEAKTNLGNSKGLEEGKQKLYTDYEQVFFNHGITQKKFEDSHKYYSSDPELYNTLFEKTIEELNKRQALIGK
ncbi:MAG: DUF4296 domain-containing protein [Sphingobacteriales bacterium JAD_PAG50586_3]|nr:MAG: DUF4296 domain-containing protein [Sphingobacteriales bacterium JAD_PAG50586_3]